MIKNKQTKQQKNSYSKFQFWNLNHSHAWSAFSNNGQVVQQQQVSPQPSCAHGQQDQPENASNERAIQPQH